MAFQPSRSLQKQISSQVTSLRAEVLVGGKVVFDQSWGEKKEFYDLASLTKVIFTTTALMRKYEEGSFKFSDRIDQHLPWWQDSDLRVGELLQHTSGFKYWLPLENELGKWKKGEELSSRHVQLAKFLRVQTLKKKKDPVLYSDLDFWLLGILLEKLYQKPLMNIWQQLSSDLGLRRTHFCLENKPYYNHTRYNKSTGIDGQRSALRGVVQDDNTYCLGGVAAHAGLFGNMKDLNQWALELRKSYLGSKGFFKQDTLKKFIKKRNRSWGYGFMRENWNYSAGSLQGPDTFGHLGFAGCSAWLNLKRDIIVNVLAHKKKPESSPESVLQYKEFRHQLHTEILESLGL